jgi:hypothetical protein
MTIVCIPDPRSGPILLNIHHWYGLLFYLSGLVGLAQPCFLLGWWLSGPAFRVLSAPRRAAWGFAAIATAVFTYGTYLGVFRNQ